MNALHNKKIIGLVAIAFSALLAASIMGLMQPLSELGTSLGAPMIQATPQVIQKHIKGLQQPLVLVNFWATWCEPCKLEFPTLVRLNQSYKDRGLTVVFVSLDNKAEEKEAAEYLRSQGIPPPYFFKGSQPLSFVSELYQKWQGAIPTSLLLRSDGQLIAAWEGETSYQEFTKIIDQHTPDKPR